MKINSKSSIFLAILAAALYALSSPLSKILLSEIPSAVMAGLLYLGAGTGMLIVRIVQNHCSSQISEESLSVRDMPYTIGMVILDIAAPLFLMAGLKRTTAANVSLLNNFEIVATSLIALFIFREKITGRLWLAIALITFASLLLSVEDASSFYFSSGSVFVLIACICWGFENNCTRMISKKDPLQIVIIKGFCSGTGSLIIALLVGEQFPGICYVVAAMLLGFIAYGLSIFFYIYAQRSLGAAKTSAYYAVAPFIGTALSLIIFRETPSLSFIIALVIMIAGAFLASSD